MRAVGIRCPTCGHVKLPVLPGRVTHAGSITIRVRECSKCASRVETREMVVKTVRR